MTYDVMLCHFMPVITMHTSHIWQDHRRYMVLALILIRHPVLDILELRS